MKILFSHVNFPAQFRRLLPYLSSLGHEVIFICRNYEWHSKNIDNVRVLVYEKTRPSSNSYIHPYLRRFESAVLEGQSVYRLASSLRQQNWIPDVVVSHIGFGNGFYLKDCFPSAYRVGLAEWYYNSSNSDVDFLDDSSLTEDQILRNRTWNAEILLEMSSLDKIITPTYWQKSQFPSFIQPSIDVLHEGVDFPHLSILKDCKHSSHNQFLKKTDDIQVLTYVSRCFEEYRGFPQVAETISQLLEQRKNLHVIMVGRDCTAYGNPRPDGKAWSEWAKEKFNYPKDRIHWTGSVSESDYHKILALSDVHLYLTVPFVLSWSLLEAMSVGLPIVASNTQPVKEVIDHMKSGLLVDFFDSTEQVAAVNKILDNKNLSFQLSHNAKTTAKEFSCEQSLVSWSSVLSP